MATVSAPISSSPSTTMNPMVPTSHHQEQEESEIDGIAFSNYQDESQLDIVMSLVGRDLSEPYSSR